MPSSYAPETRQDRITNQWVAFAPSRHDRPRHTTEQSSSPPPTDSSPEERCPFCPGHEEMLPSVIWEKPRAHPPGWTTRVVPNKYAALTPDQDHVPHTGDLYRTRASRGHQEVIIDTPDHHHSLAQMPVAQVDAVLETYLQRYHALRTRGDGLIPTLFRNHGARAGASIAHPHSQLIAPAFRPSQIEREEQAAHARYKELGDCPYCVMIENELDVADRLVWTSDSFVVFVPFAARVPYEMWILPRRHDPEFGRLEAEERTALARALRTALRRLHQCREDPDYNFFVRTALDYNVDHPHLHWSLRIRPRTTIQAGYEVGTGQHINPSIPERDAAVLRPSS
ncbi:galactose-1-phosphate uridylyltransferase [Salinibacter altiplanensis]|uniref:galactose-1-phosphate uridylyltransferase n=1 Tax=Salinibacter altiplanensis TaxID=1803181 RepID=UPI000C9F9566|nr:galactose-1-phosphate uridylyltransferase [Salinibacter altiplanensis]